MTDRKRPTWDEVWMDLAINLGRRSRCCRDQVGAVIVTEDNRVNVASYNGPPAQAELGDDPVVPDPVSRCDQWCPRAVNPAKMPDYSDCYATHAEQNALVRADDPEITFGTIYISSTPCIPCTKSIAQSSLQTVVFRVDPERPRDPDRAEWFLRNLGGLEVKRW